MGHVLKQCISKQAGADLSTKQFYAGKLDSSGAIVLCDTVGEFVVGIIDNKPKSGESVSLAVAGVVQVIAGGVIAPNGACKVSATGTMLAAVAGRTDTSDAGAAADPLLGSHVFGRSMMAANTANGDIFDMLITREGAIPTTAA